jgi:hypothetical protein
LTLPKDFLPLFVERVGWIEISQNGVCSCSANTAKQSWRRGGKRILRTLLQSEVQALTAFSGTGPPFANRPDPYFSPALFEPSCDSACAPELL